tara:strand:+ start:391 stop:1083 length:693 start_codon:yes stop_codon:yes gene_type:complete
MEVTLPIVITTALVDSINPCAIGVLLLLLGVLLKHAKEKAVMVKIAATYIGVVFLVYILSGFGLIWFQHILIGLGFATIVGTLVGTIVILAGFIEIKDFFWYGRGFSLAIPKRYIKPIQERIAHVTTSGAVVLGGLVAMVELPCTGGPYLAITTMLAKQFSMIDAVYLVIYNIIFILPLVVISMLAYYGVNVGAMKEWKQDKKKWMRLATGIVMILLGAFLIYYYQVGLH